MKKKSNKTNQNKLVFPDQTKKAALETIKSRRRKRGWSWIFNLFAKKTADWVGHPLSFLAAFIGIIIWAISGPFFHFSDTWQLIINTTTTILTFLIVFLIQNTQNRDTEIINLKLDELIKSLKGARNEVINLHDLTDKELKDLEEEYKKLIGKRTGN